MKFQILTSVKALSFSLFQNHLPIALQSKIEQNRKKIIDKNKGSNNSSKTKINGKTIRKKGQEVFHGVSIKLSNHEVVHKPFLTQDEFNELMTIETVSKQFGASLGTGYIE